MFIRVVYISRVIVLPSSENTLSFFYFIIIFLGFFISFCKRRRRREPRLPRAYAFSWCCCCSSSSSSLSSGPHSVGQPFLQLDVCLRGEKTRKSKPSIFFLCITFKKSFFFYTYIYVCVDVRAYAWGCTRIACNDATRVPPPSLFFFRFL